MAFAYYLLAVPSERLKPRLKPSIPNHSSSPLSSSLSTLPFPNNKLHYKLSIFPSLRHKAKAKPQETEIGIAADTLTKFKHLLLPITDTNPYLSEGTRQAAVTATALAKKYGADITIVVIDEKQKAALPEHETLLSSIRWHLSEEYEKALDKISGFVSHKAHEINATLMHNHLQPCSFGPWIESRKMN